MSTWIGPVGAMREVRCPAPTPAEHSRDAHSTQLLGGRVVTQIPPADRRRWSWDLQRATREELGYLTELETGLRGDEYYWLDPMALHVNMLPASASMPGVEPEHGWEVVSGSLSVPSVGVLEVDGTVVTPRVPIPGPGAVYTAAVQNVGSGDVSLVLQALDAAGTPVETPGSAGSVPAGTRGVVSGAVTHASAASLIVGVQATGTRLVSRPQLTRTSSAITWLPGMGVPRVVITGVSETYRMVVAHFPARRDWSATLIEAG